LFQKRSFAKTKRPGRAEAAKVEVQEWEKMRVGGRVELHSREITPAPVPLLDVGFMSPLKSEMGT